ncbi:MAG: hypothetical protein BWZ10_01923 [candidate division BRC1 bacterium ADurb.BinA364]|nr:MAG: hypothetical protein BWZ10_01923 [candidate division BRC1 bacterium ADurb.BinA364]
MPSSADVLRRAARWLRFPAARRDPLIPPSGLRDVGEGDFIQIGREFLRYFIELAGLRPDERVLEAGCGKGRMARALAEYLEIPGRYDGFDIDARSIAWCQRAYARRHPNFHFHFADIRNSHYNPGGRFDPSRYRFPFESEFFDFVFLTSVFTHMLPGPVENYCSEICRVLKPGGRAFITYFLLPAGAKGGSGDFSFEHALPGCRTQSAETPESAVAYEEPAIRALYAKCGLQIWEPIRYGLWRGPGPGFSYQDLVIAGKIALPPTEKPCGAR